MTLNILLGIGGTGAKVVEAIIHLGVAGLGPDNLHVGFVDQDKGNGNVNRAATLLTTVNRATRLFRDNGQAHRISGARGLFSERLSFIGEPPAVWTPHPDESETLQSIFGDLSREEKALFDLLYAPGDDEQGMALRKGYRGHPPIGSAAITAARLGDPAFWDRLTELLGHTAQGEPVRLLLAGSVFGGTGAAGFPTIARLVRRRLEEQGQTRNISVAGILMLPYFGFADPATEEGLAGNVARTEELMSQSRGALRYYAQLSSENIFNEMYLVGWDRFFNLGYHRDGGGDQRNPALLPELIAGLGACRFFDESRDVPETFNNIVASARDHEDRIRWSDLPAVSQRDRDKTYRRLGRLLRFSATMKFWLPLLQSGDTAINTFRRQPWYRIQGLGSIDFRNRPPTAELDALSGYVDAFLKWAGAIQGYAEAAGLDFDLWSIDALMDGALNTANPTDPVNLRGHLNEHAHRDAYDRVVICPPASTPPPRVTSLIEAINERRLADEHIGVGRMIAALHLYSQVTTEDAA